MTQPAASTEPVVAEVVRNGYVESRHRVDVVAIDGHSGRITFAAGDHTTPMFVRSSAKPLQTLGMLRAGWAPADDEQVALACASHSGEDRHIEVVRRILADAGLSPDDLDNTADLPLDVAAARAWIRAGGGPDPLHQNCSGKHAAMLATCVANGWPTVGYRDPEHPVQQAIRATVEELTGERVAAVAVDGCGAPLFAMSLAGLASAFASIAIAGNDKATAAPTTGREPETTADKQAALRRIATAMTTYPELVGGTGRDVTALMRALPGLVAKDGAEGVYAAATAAGDAVALKVVDGAGRARSPVMIAVLRKLGHDAPGFAALETTPVLGHGEPVGEVRAVLP
ncbi:MAG: asparaginase [Frankiales bacterium]|nr:asparaginase [Frankiales bacterium]